MRKHSFKFREIISFAELSGDWNPLHTDPVAARRSIFGKPAAHGILVLLWALDKALEKETCPLAITALRTVFLKPAGVDSELTLDIRMSREREFTIELIANNAVTTRIKASLEPAASREYTTPADSMPEKTDPLVLSDEQISSASGSLPLLLHRATASEMFPNLSRILLPEQLAALAATTRLVGSVCPGLHSIYSGLDLNKSSADQNCLSYEVDSFDNRFQLVLLNITAPGLTGTIKAFRRPLPPSQPAFSSLRLMVGKDEFSNQTALVIGGSRGLGETTAKLLAAGGANVIITFHTGLQDAQRVTGEITAGGGKASFMKYDVLASDNTLPEPLPGGRQPTHMYYFATPHIFDGAKGVFSTRLFNSFCDYYVTGFLNAFNLARQNGTTFFFYPSTTAIDELPPDMGEYTAAKAAGETLCSFLAKNDITARIYRPRFGRLATDQTVSLASVDNADPAPVILRELRAMNTLTRD